MFVARAGLTGRVLRQGRQQQSGIVALLGPKKKKKKEKFRCWVPFMLRPCIAGSVGLLILMGGAAMCMVGFYAEDFSMVKKYNETTGQPYLEMHDDKRWHLHNMTYGGPVMMGIGCFIIVISCVVVCEERDRLIKIMIEEEEQKKKKKGYKPPPKKPNIMERIVQRIKQCTEAMPLEKIDPDVEKRGIEEEKEKQPQKFKMPCTGSKSEPSEKSYSHIREALLKIPTNFFTVDIEERKTSLLPVNVTEPKQKNSIAQQIKDHYNRIESIPPPRSKSAPCLHDLKKYKEGNMGQIYLPHEELFRQVQSSQTGKRSIPDKPPEDNSDDDSVFHQDETDAMDLGQSAGGEEHMNFGYSSSSSECSTCCDDEDDDDYDILHTTCDTKDTYIQLRLETDNDANCVERGESRGSNGGSRHKVIVHQASVHSADDSADKVDPTGAIGYKHKIVAVDDKVEELTCGVARANAMGMDRFREKAQHRRSPSQSSCSGSSDPVFMSDAKMREYNFVDKSEHNLPQTQSKSTSSKIGKYAVHNSSKKSNGSQSSARDSFHQET